jgi:hypothetical protein
MVLGDGLGDHIVTIRPDEEAEADGRDDGIDVPRKDHHGEVMRLTTPALRPAWVALAHAHNFFRPRYR